MFNQRYIWIETQTCKPLKLDMIYKNKDHNNKRYSLTRPKSQNRYGIFMGEGGGGGGGPMADTEWDGLDFLLCAATMSQCCVYVMLFVCQWHSAIRSKDFYITFSRNMKQELPGCWQWEEEDQDQYQEEDTPFTVTV